MKKTHAFQLRTLIPPVVVLFVLVTASGCMDIFGSGQLRLYESGIETGSGEEDPAPESANDGEEEANADDSGDEGSGDDGGGAGGGDDACFSLETDFSTGETNTLNEFSELTFSFSEDVDQDSVEGNIVVEDGGGEAISAMELRWTDANTVLIRGSFAYGTAYAVNFSTSLTSTEGNSLCDDVSYDIVTPGAPFDIDKSAFNSDDLFIGSWRYDSPNGAGFVFLGEELYDESERLDYDLYSGPYPATRPVDPTDYTNRGVAAANLGDISGDGQADYALLVRDSATFAWELFLYVDDAHVATFYPGWGGESWEISAIIPIVLDDLNNDGIRDFMLIEDIGTDGGNSYRFASVFAGGTYAGDVTLDSSLDLGEDDLTTGVASGNFNGDDYNDLAVATVNSGDYTAQIRIYSGVDDLSTIVGTPYATISITSDEQDSGVSLAAADINADGKDELIVGIPNTADIGYMHVFNGDDLSGALTTEDATFFMNNSGETHFGFDVAAGSVATPMNPDILVSDIEASTGYSAAGMVYLFKNSSILEAVESAANEHLAAADADAFFGNVVDGDEHLYEQFGRKILLRNFDNDELGLQDVYITGRRRKDMGGWFIDEADFGCTFLGSTSLTGAASVSCNTDAKAFIDMSTPYTFLLIPGGFTAALPAK